MLSNILSLFSSSTAATQNANPVVQVTPKKSNNPFAPSENNVFLTNASFGSSASYGKNAPVTGGYFAGYYNEKPNIVGRRLFIEV